MAQDLHQRLVVLATKQHGNVTRQQLLKLGFTSDAIKHLLRIRFLHRVHLGVYAVGRPPKTALEKAAAAVLACGAGAALSHRSALAHWGFIERWPSSFDVAVPGDCRRPRITIHRQSGLQRWDVRVHVGIRVTSPAWTIVDCAPSLTDRRLARVVNDALRSKHLKRWQLAEVVARRASRPGVQRLRPFIDATDGPTRSEFEDAFLAFCERHALPRPRINTIVAGHEADAYFEAEKLIVELDGWEFHSSHESFEGDRERDANALEHGIGTVRLTWERLLETPGREAARLDKILQRRRG
jgi:predicted transcriptional regulator of viral defense system/very-short-patch-repair endonuclease